MHDYFHGKKVLIAGASGFIGQNLCSKLVELGAEVKGTYCTRAPLEIVEGVEYMQADLTEYNRCLDVTAEVDYVFMAAANTSGAAIIEKKPLTHLTPNVVMNAQMLASAYENDVQRFCFISSNTVYPVSDLAVRESDVTYDFFSKYFVVGWMKLFSEKMCEMYSHHIASPMKTVVVRPGNIYGPGDKFTWNESKVIAALIRRTIEKHDPFIVWGDGRDLKDFIFIDDFIDGLIEAFKAPEIEGAINIASSNPVTIREILAILLEIERFTPSELQFDGTKPTMIPKRLIDTEKMVELTGWKPKVSLKEGLAKTVDWYKETFSGTDPENLYDNK